MVRQRKLFAKVEPDFILGDTKAGQRFLELSEKHQLYYLRFWAYCIQKRISFISFSEQNKNKIASNLLLSQTKFNNFLNEILNKKLGFVSPENQFYLKGFKGLHSNVRFLNEDENVPQM